MKAQLEEDIYIGVYGESEILDIENIEGDVIAQMLDVIERKKQEA